MNAEEWKARLSMFLDTAERRAEALQAECRRLATFIVAHKPAHGYAPDHTCAECVPGGEMIQHGWRCGFHLAAALTPPKAQGREPGLERLLKHLRAHVPDTDRLIEDLQLSPDELGYIISLIAERRATEQDGGQKPPPDPRVAAVSEWEGPWLCKQHGVIENVQRWIDDQGQEYHDIGPYGCCHLTLIPYDRRERQGGVKAERRVPKAQGREEEGT